MTLDDETGSETQDGVDRRMDRRDALRKAAAGAAVAGVAWSAPSVKGLTLVPDYASAGTVTGLTRTFRILGVERNYSALDSGNDTHDFRGLNTPEVAASGGSAGPRPGPTPPRLYPGDGTGVGFWSRGDDERNAGRGWLRLRDHVQLGNRIFPCRRRLDVTRH